MAIIIEKADPNAPVEEAPADAATGWRRVTELIILLGAGMVTTLCFTAVIPGLQRIAKAFAGQTILPQGVLDFFNSVGLSGVAEFFGKSDPTFTAQIIVVAAPFGLAIGGFFAGWVVKKLGIRRTMFLGLAAAAVFGTAQVWVPSLRGLLLSRVLLGMSLICTDVALTTLIGARFVGKWRARLMGFRQAIGSVGTVLTMLLSGQLVKHYDWRVPGFMFLLPAIFLLLAVFTFTKPINLLEEKPDEARAQERFNILQIWPIYALALVMTICHAMPSFQMPFLLKEMNITDPGMISVVPALSAFIGILTALVFGLIYARIGRMTFVVSSVAMGLGFIGMGLAPAFGVILGFVVLEGIGAGMTIPYFATRTLDRITLAQRSRAMGYMMSAVFIGHVLNPFVLKPIRNALGVHGAFMVIGGFLVVAGVVLTIRAWFTRGKTTIV